MAFLFFLFFERTIKKNDNPFSLSNKPLYSLFAFLRVDFNITMDPLIASREGEAWKL